MLLSRRGSLRDMATNQPTGLTKRPARARSRTGAIDGGAGHAEQVGEATIEALEKHTDAPGQIGSLVGPIIPAVKAAEAKETVPAELLDQSVRESVKISVAVLRKSPVLSGLISSGKLKIVGARYDLDTGRVDILE